MRSRRHHAEEHENHERWLVSYADFITLLFAFFVVMYAISSVNEGKYRVLSDTLDAAFRARDRSASIINIGVPPRTPVPNPNASHPGAEVGDPSPTIETELEDLGREPTGTGRAFEQRPEVMAQRVREALSELVRKGTVTVTQGGEWVEVEMRSQILFDSGSAQVRREALPVLREVAKAVGRFSNRLQVEGYTDNTPVRSAMFASNWELSSMRAASVVRVFSDASVAPERMAAVGYGEFRPKAGNETPQGRQQNRRVVVRISTREEANARTKPPAAAATEVAKLPPSTPMPAEAEEDTEVAAADAGSTAATEAETKPAKQDVKPEANPTDVKSISDRPGREGPDF